MFLTSFFLNFRCEPGLIPKPDTITGCGPECVIDPDCSSGYVCDNQRCIEKPDPCNPSPCGPGAVCTTNGYGNAICRYIKIFFFVSITNEYFVLDFNIFFNKKKMTCCLLLTSILYNLVFSFYICIPIYNYNCSIFLKLSIEKKSYSELKFFIDSHLRE